MSVPWRSSCVPSGALRQFDWCQRLAVPLRLSRLLQTVHQRPSKSSPGLFAKSIGVIRRIHARSLWSAQTFFVKLISFSESTCVVRGFASQGTNRTHYFVAIRARRSASTFSTRCVVPFPFSFYELHCFLHLVRLRTSFIQLSSSVRLFTC